MKASFLYILTFIVAFLAVTGVLIIANEKFQNIFKFDFSPAHSVATIDSTSRINSTADKTVKDTAAVRKDSVDIAAKDTANISNPKIETPPVKQNNIQVKQEPKEVKKVNQQVQNNVNKAEEDKLKISDVIEASKIPDSTYNKWKKATIKIYEAMDARKVSQIIKNMPDNEARELIYSMKKKKAAEILSNLNAETVKKITRLQ